MADQIIVKPITAHDIAAFEAQDILREITDGRWDEDRKMTGKRHGQIEAILIILLGSYIRPRQLGRIYSGDTTYVLEGTPEKIITMQLPDVSFVAADRLSEEDTDPDAYHYLAPDLAMEIISPSERPTKIAAKVTDYLRAGTKQVWQVYPEQAIVIVHLLDGTSTTYTADQTLSGGDVLPGFEVEVAEIFED